MVKQYRKVKKYLDILKSQRYSETRPVENITVCPCGYKKGHTPPELSEFVDFNRNDTWGSGTDTHAWFHFFIDNVKEGQFLHIDTDKGGWNVNNPQFMLYVNGEMKQAFDTNHREAYIGDCSCADVYLYAYTGALTDTARLFADVRTLNTDVDRLYYDIRFPFEALDCLDFESSEYAHILYCLYRAVSTLDLYEVGSPEFLDSVLRADELLVKELYGEYCRPQHEKITCIGHTHIDCAWKWTFKQTREKVQRSFSTVLELMRRYPEYKFMSSQPLLYKYLKEESPELYRQVAERIREGRWECEGAMWVEADCNLPSGESLVRQIMYGKAFFRDEFGKDSRVLWLPDVFGYSAALPQILRKSGVDWFVTSKISWNDVNRMPYDTFRWRGIDGTEINSQFILAQDADTAPSKNRTTYNGTISAKMLKGTYKRYGQKHLTNEGLIPFGFGDGGGGPCDYDLELGRRAAYGVPGCPQARIEFAGDFLDRLEKKIAGNKDVPVWQGELYLEFHRGTYTSVARNKKNNRTSEFLYQDAELLSTELKHLLGLPFPKDSLHAGWESILSNQFHDVIPGSSIREVYEQCDKDYAAIKSTGAAIVNNAYQKIASAIDKRHGAVVFNPHSFVGCGNVNLDGRTVRVCGVAPKGYSVVTEFVDTNNVRIDGKTVETACLKVEFDDFWQIASIYDKREKREVLKDGEVGNELRVYADHPDTYDAWEWQEYSRDSYRTLTEVREVSIVDDGARRGLRIVRPYMRSTVSQTVWFTDGTTEIDFATTVDWHQQHQMLKVAFPVDINSDKATYEIQFGTVERPTHTNTSWDRARFEVCGHKYADLSDGGYGVSLLNDCKYGHDIHDGVMQLSLLRSPTYPDPLADQGEISMTYALYPHSGRLTDSDTVRRAYALNYPMTAIMPTGDADRVPLDFSLVRVDSDNVICETVKEEERGTATVIRLYEFKNAKTDVSITVGFEAKKVYLCNLMENELCEIPFCDGKFNYTFRGFEIATFKIV